MIQKIRKYFTKVLSQFNLIEKIEKDVSIFIYEQDNQVYIEMGCKDKTKIENLAILAYLVNSGHYESEMISIIKDDKFLKTYEDLIKAELEVTLKEEEADSDDPVIQPIKAITQVS